MNLWNRPREWSIASRLMVVTVVPVAVLFIAVAAWIYASGKVSAIRAVQRNGELLATALAQTSQFAALNVDSEALRRSMQRMLEARTEISAIEILDEQYKPIASAGQPQTDRTFMFERPIFDDKPDIDLFEGNAPHAASSGSHPLQLRPGRVIGYVRVLMSPAPVLKEERTRLLLAGVVLLIAAGVCIPLGLALSRRSIRTPLAELTRALQAVKLGQFEIRLSAKTGGEIGEMQSAFEEMATDLGRATHRLQQEVLRRTEDLDIALKQLVESNDERRRLMAHTTDLLEEERRRIARELHDEFNSSLLSIRFRAASLLRDEGCRLDPKEIDEIAPFIIEEIERLYDNARALLKRLRPEALDTLGLAGAIKAAVRTFNENQDACWLDLEAPPEGLPQLSPKVSIAAYRAVQEALSNVLKHSQASRAKVSYRFDEGSRRITISASDNGVGFAVDQKSAGFGILGMRERVEAVGGTMDIQSSPGQGTELIFSLPMDAAPRQG